MKQKLYRLCGYILRLAVVASVLAALATYAILGKIMNNPRYLEEARMELSMRMLSDKQLAQIREEELELTILRAEVVLLRNKAESLNNEMMENKRKLEMALVPEATISAAIYGRWMALLGYISAVTLIGNCDVLHKG